jgi:hypothetical protein
MQNQKLSIVGIFVNYSYTWEVDDGHGWNKKVCWRPVHITLFGKGCGVDPSQPAKLY